MGAMVWQKYSDQVAKNATITIESGTAPTDLVNYGPTVLVDDNPARVAKIEATTGAWVFAYSVKQIIEFISLIHHSFDAGADVKIQGNATNVWTAPTFSASITIPPWQGTGTRKWPVNPWRDLRGLAGYDATGFLFWRLVVTANSQNIQLGQVWLSKQYRILSPALGWNSQRILQKRYVENETSFGVKTIYSRGTNQWMIDAPHRITSALEAELVEQWFDVDGRALPWVFIKDVAVNESYLVRWREPALSHQTIDAGVIDTRFSIEEVARGLRPGV